MHGAPLYLICMQVQKLKMLGLLAVSPGYICYESYLSSPLFVVLKELQ